MPIIEGFDDDSILSVNHLGIVAGAFDTLGIAKIIDRAIPKTRHHILSHSQVIKAMSINGLGFVERRLYLFPDFQEDTAVERLLREGVRQDQLNDDVLGRTLDAIADYGPTELFNEIGAECLLPTEFGTHCIHIDTTNFRVTGEYESEFRLRRELARSGDIVTGQTKKQTKQPILKWVFFRVRRVREFSVVNGNRQMTKIANMTDELQKSSSCLDQCMKIIILKKKICGMWA